MAIIITKTPALEAEKQQLTVPEMAMGMGMRNIGVKTNIRYLFQISNSFRVDVGMFFTGAGSPSGSEPSIFA